MAIVRGVPNFRVFTVYQVRNGSSVVDNLLGYQSRDYEINPLLLWAQLFKASLA